MSFVGACTKPSRIPHIAFWSRDTFVGTWTAGSLLMRQDASLKFRASRTSVFTPRSPTPSDGASDAGTTTVSCPAARDASATGNASAQASSTTRLLGRPAKYLPSERVPTRRSSKISPSVVRTQTCDSLDPRSIAICSMAGLLFRVRLERLFVLAAVYRELVRVEASHFINSGARV